MHKKTITAPKYWKTGKKRSKWVICPKPGPHKKDESIPLLILVRDVLSLARNAREAKFILNSGKILVDGKKRKETGYPVGLMDVISIPDIKKNFRITSTKKGLEPLEINDKEKDLKISKVKNKTTMKGKKIQITTSDGKNFFAESKVGSSVLIDLSKNEIKKEIEFKDGASVLIYHGRHSGAVGKLKEIVKRGRYPDTIVIETNNGLIETLKKHAIAIGDKSPEVTVHG